MIQTESRAWKLAAIPCRQIGSLGRREDIRFAAGMKDEALRVKLQSVAFDGPVVQPLVPLRSFVLCVHAKSAACRLQGGRKSLLPRPAIVRVDVPAASRANRSWPKQAERCERARVALD